MLPISRRSPLEVKQELVNVTPAFVAHPSTNYNTRLFSEQKVAPFVSTVTAVFSHLSVGDTARWLNGSLIPAVHSLAVRPGVGDSL